MAAETDVRHKAGGDRDERPRDAGHGAIGLGIAGRVVACANAAVAGPEPASGLGVSCWRDRRQEIPIAVLGGARGWPPRSSFDRLRMRGLDDDHAAAAARPRRGGRFRGGGDLAVIELAHGGRDADQLAGAGYVPGTAMKIIRGDDYSKRQSNSAKSVMKDRLTNVRVVAELTI